MSDDFDMARAMLPEGERATAMERVRQLQARMTPGARVAAGFLPAIGETQSFNDLRKAKNASDVIYGLVGMAPLLGGVVRNVKNIGPVQRLIADNLKQMGLDVVDDASRISKSRYLEFRAPSHTDELNDAFKVRISDHDLPAKYGDSGFNVAASDKAKDAWQWSNGDWADAVAWAAKQTGAKIPDDVGRVLQARKDAAAATRAAEVARHAEYMGAVQKAKEAVTPDDYAAWVMAQQLGTKSRKEIGAEIRNAVRERAGLPHTPTMGDQTREGLLQYGRERGGKTAAEIDAEIAKAMAGK